MTSTALTVSSNTELLPDAGTLQTMMQLAKQVHESGLSKAKSPAAVLAIMLTGRELGIPAMASLRLIHDVEGKPTLAADLMASLILRDHGGDALLYETPDADKNKQATFSYRRRDWSAGERRTYTYSLNDAATANLAGKATWKAHPAAMLRARCISGIARLAFPDTVMGLYTPEEAEDAGSEQSAVTITPQPHMVEMTNGKKADAETGVIIEDSPAIGTPVNPKSDPKSPTAAETEALRAKVWALLEQDTEKLDEWRGRKGSEGLKGVSYQRLCEFLGTLNVRKADREAAELVPPLTEAEKIKQAINNATTTDELEAVVTRIADLPDGPQQYELVDLQRQKWESLEDLPAFTAV